MKRISHKKSIDLSKYANIETGEMLGSEIPTLTSVNVTDPDLVLVSSKEYMIIDAVALEYIATNFNNADLAHIIKLTRMVKGTYNILYKETLPHTKESLRKDLEYSINKFRDFLNRLYKGGVISYLSSCIKGVEHKFIVLNPNIARKGKVFRKETMKLFKDVDFSKTVDVKVKPVKKQITPEQAQQIIEQVETTEAGFTQEEMDTLFDHLGW